MTVPPFSASEIEIATVEAFAAKDQRIAELEAELRDERQILAGIVGRFNACKAAICMALPVMRAHGWHLAAAAECATEDEMIEATSAQDVYDALDEAVQPVTSPQPE